MNDRLVVRNIGQLLTMTGDQWSDGEAPLGLIQQAAMAVANGNVAWVGPESQLPASWSFDVEQVDAQGQIVMPGLVECHTHLLFAGNRAHEFELRCRGASYEEIAHAGGGILHTMQATRQASFDQLVASGTLRLAQFARYGVTTLETKSGYGLSLDSELLLLRAAQKLAETSPLEVVSTLLAAHTVPPEFKANRAGYVDLICNELLPVVQAQKLAQFFDVFCEATAFTLDETRHLFQAARNAGLALKIHSEQLTHSGATSLAAEFQCVSADHLEFIKEQDAMALAAAGTVAVLLPGATAFLGKTHFAPAHLLKKYGVPVALSTDYNPGSSHTMQLWMMGTLGCAYYHISPAQALHAMTATAAKALASESRVGILSPGRQADFLILKPHRWEEILYDFGANPVSQTFKRGKCIC